MRLTGRTRRILASGFSVAGARVVTVLCSFASMPMCLLYLGVPGFGVWATITSVVTLLAFADLGIGNGVLNLLSSALGRDDVGAIRRITATAFMILSGLGALGLTIFLVTYQLVPWDSLLGATGLLPGTTVAAGMLVLAFVFALNLPTTLVQRLQFALQMGHLNGVAQAAGGVLGLVFIYLVTKTDWGLAGMVAATLIAPLLTTWLSALWMFWQVPIYLPAPGDFSRQDSYAILKSGGQFLLLGVVFSLCQTSDSLIIANMHGPESVANYTIHLKYVSPIAFIGGLALTPLWAAYAEAMSRGDIIWIKSVFKRSLVLIVVAGCVLSIILLIFIEPVIQFWLKGRMVPDLLMVGALLVWVSIELVGKAISVFLHGMGLVSQQIWVAMLFLPVCLVAKVMFAHFFDAPGVVIGTTLAYIAIHAFPYWRLVRQWHRDHSGQSGMKVGQVP